MLYLILGIALLFGITIYLTYLYSVKLTILYIQNVVDWAVLRGLLYLVVLVYVIVPHAFVIDMIYLIFIK